MRAQLTRVRKEDIVIRMTAWDTSHLNAGYPGLSRLITGQIEKRLTALGVNLAIPSDELSFADTTDDFWQRVPNSGALSVAGFDKLGNLYVFPNGFSTYAERIRKTKPSQSEYIPVFPKGEDFRECTLEDLYYRVDHLLRTYGDDAKVKYNTQQFTTANEAWHCHVVENRAPDPPPVAPMALLVSEDQKCEINTVIEQARAVYAAKAEAKARAEQENLLTEIESLAREESKLADRREELELLLSKGI